MKKTISYRLVILCISLLLLSCSSGDSDKTDDSGKLSPAKNPILLIAIIETSMGDIELELFKSQTPNTVKNFVELAKGEREWVDPVKLQKMKKPIYDNNIFHRVIPGFMIQGGDPKKTGFGGPGYKFADEIVPELKFDRAGRVAMANTGPNTNGSQFFICEHLTHCKHLNGKHTIFGQVINGMDIVKAISHVERDARDKPKEDVVIKRIRIVERRQ